MLTRLAPVIALAVIVNIKPMIKGLPPNTVEVMVHYNAFVFLKQLQVLEVHQSKSGDSKLNKAE